MNELKHEDVMMALECCDGTLGGCERCPNYKNRFRCTIKENALALLREKDAEIERLQGQVNRLKKYDEERDIRLHARLTKTARAEAVSECIEKAKVEVDFAQAMKQIENELFNSFLTSFIGDEMQKKQTEKLFEAFNKRGVPTRTVMECLAEVSKELMGGEAD